MFSNRSPSSKNSEHFENTIGCQLNVVYNLDIGSLPLHKPCKFSALVERCRILVVLTAQMGKSSLVGILATNATVRKKDLLCCTNKVSDSVDEQYSVALVSN